jgi:Type II CAAX prenyl endopeptidase Rce1-like
MGADSAAASGFECAPAVSPGRRRDAVELAVGFALILLVIWTPRPWQRVLYLATALFLIGVMWISFEGARAMGLRTANLLRSLWVVGVALLLAGGSLLLAERMHTLHATDVGGGLAGLIKRYWGYGLWAFAQQLLLQDFFLRRMLRLLPSEGAAVLGAAAIFALAHLPNPILTLVTFVWGLAACAAFLRYRNLYPLGLTHAVLGVTLAVSLPGPLIGNMRVGLGYLAYVQQHRSAQRSQAPHIVSTHAWVRAEAPTRRS